MGGVDRASVDSALHQLVRKEIVRPLKVSSIEAEVEYSFWHGLIRDVAYGQIPRRRRAAKHVAAAEWIESIAGERVSDQAELLVYHYGEALELSRSAGLTDEAASLEDTTRRHWVLAGDRAMKLDVARAAECFGRALSLAPSEHPDRAEHPGADGVRVLRRRQISGGRANVRTGAGPVPRGRRSTLGGDVPGSARDRALGAGRRRPAVELDWPRRWTILEELPHGTELADSYATLSSERTVSGHLDEAIAVGGAIARSVVAAGGRAPAPTRPQLSRGGALLHEGTSTGSRTSRKRCGIAEGLGLARESVMPLLILAEIGWSTRGPDERHRSRGSSPAPRESARAR